MKPFILKLKQTIRPLIPSFALGMLKTGPKYGFFGPVASWQEAVKLSKGYDDPAILEKVKNSLLKVKNGEAAYERDSVLYDKIEYSENVLAKLLAVAAENGNELSLLDIGGSLGSSYFQNIGRLKHLKRIQWNIIEQEKFVECGRKNFENDQLKFYKISEVDSCISTTRPSVALLSSVLQFLEKPYEVLESLVKKDMKHIIIDRAPVFKDMNEPDMVTVQKVPPHIYDATYPARIMNQSTLKKFFTDRGYRSKEEFRSHKDTVVHTSGKAVEYKGFIFEKQT